jgi:N-acetylneuraminic acid mutarotase
MPRPRHHAAAGTDGRRLYVFGGLGPGSSETVANGFADVQIYDPTTDAWTVSDGGASAPRPLPLARSGMGKAIYLHGVFYVLGGETLSASGGQVYDRVDIYDPVENQWRAGLPMPAPRHGISAVLQGDRIYMAGGGVGAGQSASAMLTVLRLGLPEGHQRSDRSGAR